MRTSALAKRISPYGTKKGHNFAIPGVLPQNFEKTCLEYWRCLMPNFTLIGEVPAEKTRD